MKKTLLSVIAIALLFCSSLSFGQTLNLGVLSSFEGYTGTGAILNSGVFTGDVGTNGGGSITGFAPGTTHSANALTAQARLDLRDVYVELSDLFLTHPDNHAHAPAFGSETIGSGVYHIGSAGSIAGNLTLNGGGDSDAIFVIKFTGALAVSAGSNIILTNGAKACNVYFIADGAISVGASCTLKGSLLSYPGAILLGAGTNIEGRMFASTGAITLGAGCVAIAPACTNTIPSYCAPESTPADAVDVFGSAEGFVLFSSLGAVSNIGESGIVGDIGANAGAISGLGTSIHVGSIHNASAVTAQAKLDLQSAYDQLMLIPVTDASHSAVFGGGETLLPGVYSVPAAASLAGTITLDGQANPNAVFIIRVGAAFSTGAQAKVVLVNGASQNNVFWIVEAAAAMGANTLMRGTVIAHTGANTMGDDSHLDGRMFAMGAAVGFMSGKINTLCMTPEFCVEGSSVYFPIPATACYETATFNVGSCEWDVSGTQDAEPTTACYETATFNTTSCSWVVTGTQDPQPATECYETATFNNKKCTWNVSGSQPAAPTAACYFDVVGNYGSSWGYEISWQVISNLTGLSVASGSGSSFNGGPINVSVGPLDPAIHGTQFNLVVNDSYGDGFNGSGGSIGIVDGGSQLTSPITGNFGSSSSAYFKANASALACYETASFSTATCAWTISGTQDPEPATACYETATFNTAECAWNVTGTQPASPSIACYETAAFNSTSCAWDVSGTQPAEPGATASFDVVGAYGGYYASEISWSVISDLTGATVASGAGSGFYGYPINVSVGPLDVDVLGNTYSLIVNDSWGDGFNGGGSIGIQDGGTPLSSPISGNFGSNASSSFAANTTSAVANDCYGPATFNTVTCSWDAGVSPDPAPAVACYETATFNTETCEWDVTGTQPAAPTSAISFDVVGNYGSSWANELTWDVISTSTGISVANGGPGVNGDDINVSVGPLDPAVYGTNYNLVINDSYGDGFNGSGGAIGVVDGSTALSAVISGNFGSNANSSFAANAVSAVACYETLTFNEITCTWDVSGTQPVQPETACNETATFNNKKCVWKITAAAPTVSFDVVGNYGSSWGYEISWNVVSTSANVSVASGSGSSFNGGPFNVSVGPLDPAVYGTQFYVIVYDSYGDGFNGSGGSIGIVDGGTPLTTPITGNFGSYSYQYFKGTPSNGCDPKSLGKEMASSSFESSYYPNPTSETGFYEYNGLSNGGTFELINALGQVVLEMDIMEENGRLNLNLGSFNPGMYIYRVKSEGVIVDNDKIVIAR